MNYSNFPIVFPTQDTDVCGLELPNKYVMETARYFKGLHSQLVWDWTSGNVSECKQWARPSCCDHPMYRILLCSPEEDRAWFGAYVRQLVNTYRGLVDNHSGDGDNDSYYDFNYTTRLYHLNRYDKPYFNNSYLINGLSKVGSAYTKQQRKWVLDNYKGSLVFYNGIPNWVKETKQRILEVA